MSFKTIGDNLTQKEFNDYVTLLRYNFPLNENLRITAPVMAGIYANYEFDFSEATVIDNGILITDETLSATNTVKLDNPIFTHSTYVLNFKVMNITDYNLYIEDRQNYISYEEFNIELSVENDTEVLDLSGFEEGMVLIFDVEVEIRHDIQVIS